MPTLSKLPVMSPPIAKLKIVKKLDITVDPVNCPNESPNCGLLHDNNTSLRWGKFKDLVDKLQDSGDETEQLSDY